MPISTVGAEGCRRQRRWVGPSESCRGSCLDARTQVGVVLPMVAKTRTESLDPLENELL